MMNTHRTPELLALLMFLFFAFHPDEPSGEPKVLSGEQYLRGVIENSQDPVYTVGYLTYAGEGMDLSSEADSGAPDANSAHTGSDSDGSNCPSGSSDVDMSPTSSEGFDYEGVGTSDGLPHDDVEESPLLPLYELNEWMGWRYSVSLLVDTLGEDDELEVSSAVIEGESAIATLTGQGQSPQWTHAGFAHVTTLSGWLVLFEGEATADIVPSNVSLILFRRQTDTGESAFGVQDLSPLDVELSYRMAAAEGDPWLQILVRPVQQSDSTALTPPEPGFSSRLLITVRRD